MITAAEPTGLPKNGKGESAPVEEVFREFYRKYVAPRLKNILELSAPKKEEGGEGEKEHPLSLKERWGLFCGAYFCISQVNGRLYAAIAKKSIHLSFNESRGEVHRDSIDHWAVFKCRLPKELVEEYSDALIWHVDVRSATDEDIRSIIREITGAWPARYQSASMANAFRVNPGIQEVSEIFLEAR